MTFKDWQGGMRITADRMRGSTFQAPQPWDIVWTDNTGAPLDFGNSNVDVEYQTSGGMCIGRVDINFGSTADFGTGSNWRFSTPLPVTRALQDIGRGELWRDSSSNGERMGTRVRNTTVSHFELEISSGRVDGVAAGASGIVDTNAPWTWAPLDNINFHFAYPLGD